MIRRRLAAAFVVTCAAGGLAMPTPAHADTPEATTTVAWVVTSGSFADRFREPQTLFTGTIGACGQPPLQVDDYKYGTPEHIATVDHLREVAQLNNSSEDSSVWISNVDLPATEPCAPPTAPPPVTPSPTTTPPTPTSTPSSPPTSKPSPTPSAVTTPTSTPSNPSATPSHVTVPATGTTTLRKTGTGQSADELAYTGSSPVLVWVMLGLLLTGAVMVIRAAILRRREKRS